MVGILSEEPVATVQQLNQNSTTILHRNLGREKILQQLKYL